MGLHDEARLDAKLLDLIKLMNVYLNHFPKHEKYGLALEIRRAAYDVYGHVVEAQKRYFKKTTLTNLDVRHEQLRMFVRLAHQLGYFAFKDAARITGERTAHKTAEHRFLALSGLVDEVGRMIGGWIAADRATDKREAS